MRKNLKRPLLWKEGRKVLLFTKLTIVFILLSSIISNASAQSSIKGKVTDEQGEPLPGVTVVVKGTTKGVVTGIDGDYSLDAVSTNAVLVFSFVGMTTQEIAVGNQTTINVTMKQDAIGLEEVIAIGYGTQKKESLTGAISGVESEKLDAVKAPTASAALAGQIPGVSFRQKDGRPGATASIQIRNFGDPLYIIDGVEKDAGHFNNIAPNDIESISVLKDASAAIYGVRAGNGVIIVTTKRGKANTKSKINLSVYHGWQNIARLPETTNAYEWMVGKVRADMNKTNPGTNITPEELEKWKQGTEYGYQSYDWKDLVIEPNAPQTMVNLNSSGGSERIQYYTSLSHLDQTAVLGREFKFYRTNVQSNVDAMVTDRIKFAVQINGRIEVNDNPGVPGGDDYVNPLRTLYRNRPTEHPYANNNPDYVNNIGHNAQNWALFTKDISGYSTNTWRVFQSNFSVDYDIPIKGLTAQGKYSYYFADRFLNEHEYTYETYTYRPEEDRYDVTFAMTNPWRQRRHEKVLENVMQGKLNYINDFEDHHIAGTFVAERIQRKSLGTNYRTLPQTNELPLMYFDDLITFGDYENESARIGYITRLNYNFGRKYYLEMVGRYDGSWKFVEEKRWGFFPSVSAGWRITEEEFMQNMLGSSDLDLKIRGSYGIVGDDNVGIGDFDYLTGYNYGSSLQIIDGVAMSGSRDRGIPITNITWYTSKIFDIGFDYSLFDNKLRGAVDYFSRVRDGLKGVKYDLLIPSEVGYTLPAENVNSDGNVGIDASIEYNGKAGEVDYTVGMNFTYARHRFLDSYKPRFGSAWDEYRNSSENRWTGREWGYDVIGQFESLDEIQNYPVDIDGKGNSTLLPGDLIYEDVNGDGVIDGMDQRPIGYPRGGNDGAQPILNFGFINSIKWKNIDFTANFSGGGMYSFQLGNYNQKPFYSGGALLTRFYEDSWQREDPFDLNSEWAPGTYPAIRYNTGNISSYNKVSTFWLKNVWYLRARSIEMGYTLPNSVLDRIKFEKVRVYVNTYNLFSIDNMKKYNLDPEVAHIDNRNYPQSRIINVGFDITF